MPKDDEFVDLGEVVGCLGHAAAQGLDCSATVGV